MRFAARNRSAVLAWIAWLLLTLFAFYTWFPPRIIVTGEKNKMNNRISQTELFGFT